MEYRALLMEYRVYQYPTECRKCKALLIEYRALLIEYRALLMEYRALLMEYRALLMIRHC